MKRIILFCFVFLMILNTVFAVGNINPATDSAYSALLKPYEKTSARRLAMGTSGLVGFSNQDALYYNPASLGEKGLVFNLPSVAFTLYNFNDLLKTGVITDAIKNPNIFSDQSYIISKGADILPIYAGRNNNIMFGLDAGAAMKAGCFAFGVDVQTKLHTVNKGSTTDVMVIPQLDAVASLGLGFRLFKESPVNIDFGTAVRFNVRGYSKAISANDLIANASDMMGAIKNTPMYIGFAVPVDVGVNLNLPFGFSFGSVLRNINGKFYMTANDNYDAVMQNMTDAIFKNDFTFDTPMSLDMGMAWNAPFRKVEKFIDMSLTADVVDTIPLFKDFSTDALLKTVRLGVEVELFKIIELRAGLNSGYYSFGAGVNLFNVIHLEASYYKQELGAKLGDNAVDALTIKMNIGWER